MTTPSASPNELGTASSSWLEQNYNPYKVAKAKVSLEAKHLGEWQFWQDGSPHSTAGHVLMYAAQYRRLFDKDLLTAEQLETLKPEVQEGINSHLSDGKLVHASALMQHYLTIFGERGWSPEDEGAVIGAIEKQQQEEIRKARREGMVFIRTWDAYTYRNQQEIVKAAHNLSILTGVRPESQIVGVALSGYKKSVEHEMNRELYGSDPPYSYGESDDHALWEAAMVRILSAQKIEFLPGEGLKIQD